MKELTRQEKREAVTLLRDMEQVLQIRPDPMPLLREMLARLNVLLGPLNEPQD